MKILLIEDDDMTRELLTAELSAVCYVVEQAVDGELGLELASLWAYDLILLDLKIPKLDGLSLCRQLRNRDITTPILMLTAQNAQEDIVTGLDAGADDYVTKPFEMDQVLARIRALLRRGSMATTQTPALKLGNLSLNPATTNVTYEDRVIPLTPKEYSLLELFLRNPQRVFSRSSILDHLWTMDDYPTEGAVTNLVKDLRNRLKRNGVQETIIQTVYGLGYRLKNEGSSPGPTPSPQPGAVSPSGLGATATLESIAARFQQSIQQRVAVLEDVTRAFQAGAISSPQRELACEEAHRLAGGLGTFGYEEGSVLARQIEHLLEGDGPLDQVKIAKLSQNLLALKQAVASEPKPTQATLTLPPSPCKHLVTIEVPQDIGLPLQALGTTCNWVIEAFAKVEEVFHQGDDYPMDAILLFLNPKVDATQKLAPLAEIKRRFPTLPVVIISRQESLAERVQAVRLGAERYLVDPITPDKLLDTLTQLVVRPEASPSRVLVVDHNPEVCSIIQDLLTPWGMEVTTLVDPNQFWEVLRHINPDLLLLEQDMPTFSGADLCRVVRKDSQYGDLPILMMTAQSNKMSVQQVFELGCDDLINKPIISPELITRVLSRIERSQLQQRLETMRQQQSLYWHRQENVDPITLMPNTRYFYKFLQQQWERHRQDQAPISLILCTPDDLDTYQHSGPQMIDQLLRQIANILQSTINSNIDLAARYSDDAFGIVLPNTNLDGALRVVNRIQQAIKQIPSPQNAKNQNQSPLSLSLGIGGTIPDVTQLCEDLLKTADHALKAAKARGGNTFCLYPM